jgi:hypothetical protein
MSRLEAVMNPVVKRYLALFFALIVAACNPAVNTSGFAAETAVSTQPQLVHDHLPADYQYVKYF